MVDMGGYTIAEVSRIIRDVLETHGYLCRFGGDEFCGCFVGMEQEQGVELSDEVRKRVAGHNFTKDGIRVEPTISIGVATFPTSVASPGQLFNAADKAMYEAKNGGRNRVAGAKPLESA